MTRKFRTFRRRIIMTVLFTWLHIIFRLLPIDCHDMHTRAAEFNFYLTESLPPPPRRVLLKYVAPGGHLVCLTYRLDLIFKC
jgi:hypothetical protein